MIDLRTLTLAEINKLKYELSGEKDVIPYVEIISKDCRSKSTKEWLGLWKPERHAVLLYRIGKNSISYDRHIPEDILINNEYHYWSTSSYEIKDNKVNHEALNYILKIMNNE